jgi:hypothetical protein
MSFEPRRANGSQMQRTRALNDIQRPPDSSQDNPVLRVAPLLRAYREP